jgi:hypothetical protein
MKLSRLPEKNSYRIHFACSSSLESRALWLPTMTSYALLRRAFREAQCGSQLASDGISVRSLRQQRDLEATSDSVWPTTSISNEVCLPKAALSSSSALRRSLDLSDATQLQHLVLASF